MSDDDQINVTAAGLLRGQFAVRDGLAGDTEEANRLAVEIFDQTRPSPQSPPSDVFRENTRGGRFAPRSISIGDKIGPSAVRAFVGVVAGDKLFEVDCAGCGEAQIRSAGSLNQKLRYGGVVECPQCVRERVGGRPLQRAETIRERVMAGGPLYTGGEILGMCADIQRDLVAEFGPMNDADDFAKPSDMFVAVGWPYSARDARAKNDAEHRMQILNEQETRDGQLAANLLRAIESSDREAIEGALAVTEAAQKRRPATPPVIHSSVVEESIPSYIERVAHCVWCRQRFAWLPARVDQCVCSASCAKRWRALLERRAEDIRAAKARLERKPKPSTSRPALSTPIDDLIDDAIDDLSKIEPEQVTRADWHTIRLAAGRPTTVPLSEELFLYVGDFERLRLPQCWCVRTAIEDDDVEFEQEEEDEEDLSAHTSACVRFRAQFEEASETKADSWRWWFQVKAGRWLNTTWFAHLSEPLPTRLDDSTDD